MENSKGDLHNFGLSVFSHEGKIFKPRALLWEWIFLSKKSKIRNFLHKELLKLSHASAFDIIPSINFYDDLELFKNGRVEQYKLKSSLIPRLGPIDLERIGSLIAIFTWFGISDIHKENILIGQENGKLVVLPFDIESTFNNYILPSQTLLIPANIQQYDDYGLSRIFNSTSKEDIGIVLQGYMSTTTLLNNKSQTIRDEILDLSFFKISPIRVILRRTREYQDAMHVEKLESSKFIQEELDQMSRGDIPYFFRYFFSNDIYYYSNQALSIKKKIDLKILKTTFPMTYKNDCFLLVSPECSRPKELLGHGALQLAKFLINKKVNDDHHCIQYKDINIEVRNELIKLIYKKEESFVCKKN